MTNVTLRGLDDTFPRTTNASASMIHHMRRLWHKPILAIACLAWLPQQEPSEVKALMERYRNIVSDAQRKSDPFVELDCALIDELTRMFLNGPLSAVTARRSVVPPAIKTDNLGAIVAFEDDMRIGGVWYRARLNVQHNPRLFALWQTIR